MTDDNNKDILKRFPKKRPSLPEEYKKNYGQHIMDNREGNTKVTGLSKKMESWMHKKVAADIGRMQKGDTTLEIGAGTLNQLDYEPNSLYYDIVEPFKELYSNSKLIKRIRKIYHDISDIDESIKYNRIISIAAFEHLLNLPDIVYKSILLLKDDGHLRVAIPNTGTILWRLGTLITGYEFRNRYKLDYQVLMRYEHINTADEIEKVLKYFFNKVKCSIFGINKKLAFYIFYDCTQPDFKNIKQYSKHKY